MPKHRKQRSVKSAAHPSRAKHANSVRVVKPEAVQKASAGDVKVLPPLTKGPVGQSAGWRARIDQALPPFTARRYFAIWVVVMIPLLLVMLLLLQPWETARIPARGTATAAPKATPTAKGSAAGRAAADGLSRGVNGSPNANNVSGTGGVRATPTISPTTVLANIGKYLVIDTTKGRIVAKLNTDPSANVGKTIAALEQRANSGMLDGRAFDRVEDWMVQAGDPSGGGKVPAEYNKIPFTVGSLGAVHGADATQNSDSQFLIAKTDAPFLNEQYTNFGQVIQGMDVVNKIAAGDKMTKVTVETR